jgi:hypothetical protein
VQNACSLDVYGSTEPRSKPEERVEPASFEKRSALVRLNIRSGITVFEDGIDQPLWRNVIRALLKSYGLISTVTRSPGRMRM